MYCCPEDGSRPTLYEGMATSNRAMFCTGDFFVFFKRDARVQDSQEIDDESSHKRLIDYCDRLAHRDTDWHPVTPGVARGDLRAQKDKIPKKNVVLSHTHIDAAGNQRI